MKTKPFVLLYFVIIALLFVSCSADKGTGSTNESELILPLTVGNEWLYVNSINSDSIMVESRVSEKAIIDYDGNDLEIWFWDFGDPEEIRFLLRNEEDGLIFYGVEEDGIIYLGERSIFLKYPVDIDDFWDSPFSVGDSVKCLSTNQSIETPVDNYNCYLYGLFEENEETPYSTFYCYPNIGIVALNTNINSPSASEKWFLLKSYILN